MGQEIKGFGEVFIWIDGVCTREVLFIHTTTDKQT